MPTVPALVRRATASKINSRGDTEIWEYGEAVEIQFNHLPPLYVVDLMERKVNKLIERDGCTMRKAWWQVEHLSLEET